ncbi:MAG: hypothetical protein ABI847_12460 [Anaerolineales bacterium]
MDAGTKEFKTQPTRRVQRMTRLIWIPGLVLIASVPILIQRAEGAYAAAKNLPWRTAAIAAELGEHSAARIDRQGQAWFFTASGNAVAYTADGRLVETIPVPNSERLKADPSSALVAVGPHRELWVASMLDNTVKVQDDQGAWRTYSTAKEVMDLAVDGRGIGWIMTRQGLYTIDPQASSHEMVAALAPSNLPLGQNPGADIPQRMTVDRMGRFWITYGDGYLYGTVDRTNWTRMRTLLASIGSGRTTIMTACLDTDAQGQLWVCGPAILGRLDADGQWQIYDVPDEVARAYGSLNSAAIDGNGNIWVGTDGEGLLVRDKAGGWQIFTPENAGIDSAQIQVIGVDSRATVWADTGSNLYVMNSGQSLSAPVDERPRWRTLASVILLVGVLLGLASIPGLLYLKNLISFAVPFVGWLAIVAGLGLISRSNDEAVFFFCLVPVIGLVAILHFAATAFWLVRRNRWIALGFLAAVGFYVLGTVLTSPSGFSASQLLYPFFLPVR